MTEEHRQHKSPFSEEGLEALRLASGEAFTVDRGSLPEHVRCEDCAAYNLQCSERPIAAEVWTEK